jgi:hypothetical protein
LKHKEIEFGFGCAGFGFRCAGFGFRCVRLGFRCGDLDFVAPVRRRRYFNST